MFHFTREKRERTECKNHRVIILLSVVIKIYVGILVDRVRIVTEGLTGGEQGSFRPGRGCVDQIFTLKQIGEIWRRTIWLIGRPYDRSIECMMWVANF